MKLTEPNLPQTAKTLKTLSLWPSPVRFHVHMATAYFKYASIKQLSFMSCTLAVSVFQLCVVLHFLSFCSCSYVLFSCAVSSVWLPTTELLISNSTHATRHLFGVCFSRSAANFRSFFFIKIWLLSSQCWTTTRNQDSKLPWRPCGWQITQPHLAPSCPATFFFHLVNLREKIKSWLLWGVQMFFNTNCADSDRVHVLHFILTFASCSVFWLSSCLCAGCCDWGIKAALCW